ncbi:hypothetical protein AAG612_13250 [Citromicrobium bathyomarinum]|uniref:hypothetical protein n=1 Tax=Citromicrobium bathyomarinum TaxID=72174 RepID=UPI00315AF7EE
MNFRNFDLLDKLFGSLLAAMFVLGTLSIATEVRASREAGLGLVGPDLAVSALATAAPENAPA